jgi:hypothetical protein
MRDRLAQQRWHLKAGFRRVGMTGGGLVALQLSPGDMPMALAALPARGSTVEMFDA